MLLACVLASACALASVMAMESGTATHQSAAERVPALEGLVTVGVVATEAPMQIWPGEASGPSGYDIDLIQQLFAQADVTLRWKRFASRTQLMAALDAAEVDLVASATVAPSRFSGLTFSKPYLAETQLMVARQEQTSAPGNPDLAGYRLGVVAGTAGTVAAGQYFPLASTTAFASQHDALQALDGGQVDMLLISRSTALAAMSGRMGLRVLKSYALPEGQLRLAARADAAILAQWLDKWLAARPDEMDRELADKWLDHLNIPVSSVAPLAQHQAALRVGYLVRDDASGWPGGEAAGGLGVDLMRAAAGHAGLPVGEVIGVESSGEGMEALQAGELDVLVGPAETGPGRGALPFVGPYRSSLLAIVGRSGHGSPGLDRLANRKLAMVDHFVAEGFVAQSYPGAQVVVCESMSDCMDMVEQGEADATVAPMDGLQERLGDRGAGLQISGVVPLWQLESNLVLGPQSAHLAQRLREGLDMAMAQDLADIERRHLTPKSSQGLDWSALWPWALGALLLAGLAALAMWWHLMVLRRQVAAKQQASEQAEAYLGFMTHEVRNALQSVAGASVLLNEMEDEADATPRERQKVLQLMTRSSRSTMTLMDALMDRYRYVQGKVELRPDDVDLVELLQQLVDDIQPAAHAKRLKLSLSMDPAACGQWRIDPVRVQQVLRNLIINAVKFTREGGIAVRLGVEPGEDFMHASMLRIAVSDTGEGMDAGMQAQVFEGFHSSGGDRPGTGLGLALCRDLAKAMGGQLELETAPGKGSTFTLAFEAFRPEHLTAPPELETTLHSALVVDGSPVYGLLLKRALINDGVASVLVESVKAVEEELNRPDVAGYDLVLVEATLVDGSYADVISLLQKRLGDMPYVVVMNQGDEKPDQAVGSRDGVLDVVAKTSDVYSLIDRVTQAYESAQLRRVEWGGMASRPPRDAGLPQSQL
ncbi:hypothetical protein NBRC116584_00650 [Hydrogenophaga sp. 5NK40-0174]